MKGPWLITEMFMNGGSTLNHELGHRFELCHAFSTFNTAPDMNPAAECGGPTPGVTECKPEMGPAFPCPTPAPGTAYPTSCADNDCYTCYCTWGTGNNFMGYTLPRKGITISQWAQMYGDAISEMPSFLGFETCMPPKPPVIINANTNVVWEVPKFMPNDIEILTGSQLTIKCEVLMGQNKRIVVHRGAKLLIDGGTITTLCPGSFWSGIFVHGFTNVPQPSPGAMPGPNQSGIVYVDNFSTIEHAMTAISTSAPGFSWPDQQDRYGGVIYARESNFINNRKAVEFMPHNLNNESQFLGCRFEEEGNFTDNTQGVTIWGCNGIDFQNCTFRNGSCRIWAESHSPYESIMN